MAAGKKRMLIVVNPYATTVSDRLKNLIVYALKDRFDIEAITTEGKAHATEIGREARQNGFDIIVAFGGDGTLNEIANGVAGTDIPISVLPGGSTNVVCRTLGIPDDVVDATEHLLSLADRFHPRKIDLGRVNDRAFVFSCGVGIDAAVVKRVDTHPRLKARTGEYYFAWAAIAGFYRHYLRNPARFRVEMAGETIEGVTALTQNSDPFTFFGRIPIRVCEDVSFDSGALSMAVLKRSHQRDIPSLVARLFWDRMHTPKHRQIVHASGVTKARLEAISTDADGELRPLPVQVDGDYIGDCTSIDYRVEPGALTVVA